MYDPVLGKPEGSKQSGQLTLIQATGTVRDALHRQERGQQVDTVP